MRTPLVKTFVIASFLAVIVYGVTTLLPQLKQLSAGLSWGDILFWITCVVVLIYVVKDFLQGGEALVMSFHISGNFVDRREIAKLLGAVMLFIAFLFLIRMHFALAPKLTSPATTQINEVPAVITPASTNPSDNIDNNDIDKEEAPVPATQ